VLLSERARSTGPDDHPHRVAVRPFLVSDIATHRLIERFASTPAPVMRLAHISDSGTTATLAVRAMDATGHSGSLLWRAGHGQCRGRRIGHTATPQAGVGRDPAGNGGPQERGRPSRGFPAQQTPSTECDQGFSSTLWALSWGNGEIPSPQTPLPSISANVNVGHRAVFAGERGADLQEVSGRLRRSGYPPGTYHPRSGHVTDWYSK
jgi:hypothetical protein